MSGTARSPRYVCSVCRDSGLVSYSSKGFPFVILDEDGKAFMKCPACDGKSRLCGEIDEPAPETPTLDELRNVKHGGPA
jgi:hypothetical protein